MKYSSEVIKGKVKGTFIDENCTIEIMGKTFTSGGAFIAINKITGKLGGRVYVNEEMKYVSNWDESIKVKCFFGSSWWSNFGDRRKSIYFRYEKKYLYGVLFSADYNQLASVREVKPWD